MRTKVARRRDEGDQDPPPGDLSVPYARTVAVVESCIECRYYRAAGTAAYGECHRYPPTEWESGWRDPATGQKGRAMWPYVREHDSCGEFVDRSLDA